VVLYASKDAAERHIESADVEAGEYEAFDSEGRVLVIDIEGHSDASKRTRLPFGFGAVGIVPVRIRAGEEAPSHQDDVIRILTAALPTRERATEPVDLARLVERASAAPTTRGGSSAAVEGRERPGGGQPCKHASRTSTRSRAIASTG
jgi:hypothetical protein